jgi:hypothetical protein
MNANELADELEIAQGNNNADELIPNAIAMLRQQQSEIEALKAHPVKELTDEEIGQIWKDCMESPYMQVSNPVGFARAILRKAQESDKIESLGTVNIGGVHFRNGKEVK